MNFYPENIENWGKIDSALKKSENIFISTHINPDGDALGSEIALFTFLEKKGKKCRIINHSVTPEIYKFLDSSGIIETFENGHLKNRPQKSDIVFFLDLGNTDRLGDIESFLLENPAYKIMIDHHLPTQIFGDIAVINSSADSTGSLVYDLLLTLDSSIIDEKIAFAIFTAIVTDTGYFTYSNTTSKTHLIVASLYKYGVNVQKIRKKIDNGQPFGRQKLLGMALNNLNMADNGSIAYSYITKDMFEKTGTLRENTDGIIDQIRIIKNIKVAVLLVEESVDSYKISFRSVGNTPVNKIAESLGGGGHPRAAGAYIKGNLEDAIRTSVNAVEKYL
jgi:bifunctional oligoribonuclease and PAP phosphatase NrnA